MGELVEVSLFSFVIIMGIHFVADWHFKRIWKSIKHFYEDEEGEE